MLTMVSPEIDDYVVSKSEPHGALLQELVEVTHRETSAAMMLCGPMEGRFLKIIVQLLGAKRVLEIGMFTGYSALSMAEGLPQDGELITCDVDDHCIGIAQSFFDRSKHGKKITIMKGPALETMKTLKAPFDLVFIDADKGNYSNYYQAALELLRPGGAILIDNVLWTGKVVKPDCDTSRAIAKLNDVVAGDERVDRVLLPIRDGVYLIRKR